MKFSVLLSVYYKENSSYLIESLNSILDQTLIPNQIVLVKDGPLTKKLNKIITNYKEEYFDIFEIINIEKNKGLGIALDIGLKKCKYDIVARMDTDDIAKKDRFEKQVNFLKEHDEIDLVGSWVDEFYVSPNNIVSCRKLPEYHEDIEEFAKRRNPFNHPTVMFRKKAVINSGGYQEFFLNEDYYLWVRMINSGNKMYNIPKSLLLFRINKDFYKRRGGLRYLLQDIKLQKEFLKLGFINIRDFIVNTITRCTIRILPNFLRSFIYKYKLREKDEL